MSVSLRPACLHGQFQANQGLTERGGTVEVGLPDEEHLVNPWLPVVSGIWEA